ncbi:hypothetical protein [Roseovarius sp. Pro17]|uniref:hypothetical protein n=1 Tax=Roseovarius sp. Pro17 TaxID=3108175 RepID=UPI002D78CCF3|nr:hypothetical protein [Roseovarius sp. Pro17]
MITRIAFVVICLLASATTHGTAQERKPSQPVFRYLHEAKIICGRIKSHHPGPLAGGHYGTVINLFNPHPAPLKVTFELKLANPPGQLTGGKIVALEPMDLPAQKATAVDCRSLRALTFPYGFPKPFVEGFLSIDALQPLVVSGVWTTAAPEAKHHLRLTSLDVDHVPARAVEVPPANPNWGSVGSDVSFCDRLRRSSVILNGVVGAQSYTFDEAEDEGPREVSRIEDVSILAGAGGVVAGPVDIRLRRGFFPDGRFLDTSEMPVLTVGARYLLILPNHGWVHEPISLDDVFRIETVDDRDILVDQHGFAVTDVEGGRSDDPVSTPEFLFRTPQLTGTPAPENAMSSDDFVAESEDCAGPVLSGPYTAYPLVPPTIRGVE